MLKEHKLTFNDGYEVVGVTIDKSKIDNRKKL